MQLTITVFISMGPYIEINYAKAKHYKHWFTVFLDRRNVPLNPSFFPSSKSWTLVSSTDSPYLNNSIHRLKSDTRSVLFIHCFVKMTH